MGNSRDLREGKGNEEYKELDLELEWLDSNRIKLRALNSATPLTPITAKDLFISPDKVKNLKLAQILEHLTFEEKMLAGSPHYTTYFGRDTLLSLLLLMPILQPNAIEAALGSVFERMSKKGEVAHEEDYRQEPTVYEYNMVDENLLLAPVVAQHLTSTTSQNKEDFLNKHYDKLEQNFALLKGKIQNYAHRPSKKISLLAIGETAITA